MAPECLHCNRTFLDRQALQQHIASSSVEHPSCTACDRRFTSQAACDSHMAAKHPPTFTCSICRRSYLSPGALEDHYRGSMAHPNCSKCGRGFKDTAERDEHHRTMHPRVSCTTCGGIMIYQDALEDHYRQSPSHPKCTKCERGLKDNTSLLEHDKLVHPKLQCVPCDREFDSTEALENHYLASLNHPDCVLCHRGLKDDLDYRSHMDSHSSLLHVQPDFEDHASDHVYSPLAFPIRRLQELNSEERVPSPVMAISTKYSSPIMETPTPFLHSSSLPPPGKGVEQAWAAHENVQAPPTSRLASPSWLRSTYPPIPGGSLAGYKKNDSSPAALSFESSSSLRRSSLSTQILPSPTADPPSAQHLRAGSWDDSSHTTTSPVEGSSSVPLSEPALSWRARRSTIGGSNPFSQLSPPSRAFPPGFTGSSKATALGPIVTRNGPGRLDGNWRKELADRLRETTESEIPPPPGLGIPKSAISPEVVYGVSASSQTGMNNSSSDEGPPKTDNGRKFKSSAEKVEINEGSQPQNGSASSFTALLPKAPSPPLLRIDVLTDEPESEPSSSHSRSPDVFSPFGLAPLPLMSPLVGTPVGRQWTRLPDDADNVRSLRQDETASLRLAVEQDGRSTVSTSAFGTPETPSSLRLVTADTRLPDTGSQTEAATPSSVSVIERAFQAGGGTDSDEEIMSIVFPLESPLSLGVSPVVASTFVGPFAAPLFPSGRGEEAELKSNTRLMVSPPPPPSSESPIIVRETPNEENERDGRNGGGSASSSSSSVVVVTAPGTPTEPAAPVLDPASSTEPTRTSPSASPPAGPRLHCRLCRSDPCVDVTAAMCGHIFCYGCITEEVMKTSRCPACNTPTLLYCLFRLRLSG